MCFVMFLNIPHRIRVFSVKSTFTKQYKRIKTETNCSPKHFERSRPHRVAESFKSCGGGSKQQETAG